MVLEACSFRLSSSTPPPLTPRAGHSKMRRLRFIINKEPRRRPSSSLSSASSPPACIPFSAVRHSSRRCRLVCHATNIVDEVLEVTDESWDELIQKSRIPVLVEFWAPSCGPCKMMVPVLDKLAKEYAGKIACFKINTDDSLKMASKYGIRSIPTVLLLKDGEKVESVTGAVKKSALSAMIDKYLDQV